MKSMFIFGSLAVVAGCLHWAQSGRSVAEAHTVSVVQETVPVELAGQWETTGYSIAGQAGKLRGGMFIDPESSETKLGSRSIRFLKSDNGKSWIEVCGLQDETRMGGGGPRKGICRVNAEGELEIIEARSAAHGFPIDFSLATKSKSVCWSLRPTASK